MYGLYKKTTIWWAVVGTMIVGLRAFNGLKNPRVGAAIPGLAKSFIKQRTLGSEP